MKKSYLIPVIGLLGLLSVCLFVFSCNKGLQNSTASSLRTGSATQPPNNGQCPYDCHDVRCKQYLSGYCGPTLSPPMDTVTIIFNPNNPQDFVGAAHNNGIIRILPGLTGNESLPQLFTLSENYLASTGVDTTGVGQGINEAYSSGYFTSNSDSLPAILYQAGLIDAQTSSYLSQINAAAHLNFDVSTSAAANYNAFAGKLISIENEVAGDNSITAAERSMLLSAGAVGRYSAGLWINVNAMQKSLSVTTDCILICAIWDWLKGIGKSICWSCFSLQKAIGADVAGAAGGASSKLLAGNSSVTYWVAAGVGAIGGSSVSAITQLFGPKPPAK